MKNCIFLAALSFIVLFAAESAYSATCTWTDNDIGDSLWSTAGNWDTVPQAGDDVIFDSTSQTDCIADDVPDNLNSITLAASYGFTVTFQQDFVNGRDTLTLTDHLTVNNGTILCEGDRDGDPVEGEGITIIAVNVYVEVAGEISANYLGFPSSEGPGAGEDNDTKGAGAAYGGKGGEAPSSGLAGSPYGSLTQPISLGSGGGVDIGDGNDGGAGGGAIKIVASGTVRIDGIVSANGQNRTDNEAGGGSGGSIWIITDVLDFGSTGDITATGGNGDSQWRSGAGSGGRIALEFTVAASTFDGFISTAGGKGTSRFPPLVYEYVTWGGAGTLSLPNSADLNLTVKKGAVIGLAPGTHVFGDLIIRGGGVIECQGDADGDPVNGAGVVINALSLLIEPGEEIWIDTIVVNDQYDAGEELYDGGNGWDTPGGTLGIPGNIYYNSTTDPIVYNAGEDIWIDDITANAAYNRWETRVYDGGDGWETDPGLGIAGSQETMYFYDANGNGVYDIAGKISCDYLGFLSASGPGAGIDDARPGGGGHGGPGGDGGSGSPGGGTYGSATAPTSLGSGGGGNGGFYFGGPGGGAVQFLITGTATIDGIISANGGNQGTGDEEAGGSGGSIWIVTGIIEGGGSLIADGGNGYIGNPPGYGGGGGGGRIALHYVTDGGHSISYSVAGGAGANVGFVGTYDEQAVVPEISSASIITITGIQNDTVIVAFSMPLSEAVAEAPINYLIKDSATLDTVDLTNALFVYDPSLMEVAITIANGDMPDSDGLGVTRLTTGEDYDITQNFLGYTELNVPATGDSTLPQVTDVTLRIDISDTTVDVVFDEVVDQSEAETTTNYALETFVEPDSIVLLSDNVTARLTFLVSVTAGNTLDISSVPDLAGNTMALADDHAIVEYDPVQSASIVTATGVGNDTVTIQFKSDVGEAPAETPANFLIEHSSSGDTIDLPVAAGFSYNPGTFELVITLSDGDQPDSDGGGIVRFDTGEDYNITFSNLFAIPFTTSNVTASGDSTSPQVVSVRVDEFDNTLVDVVFDETVDASEAETLANYALETLVEPDSAVLQVDNVTVTLTFNAGVIAHTNTMDINNVNDLAGNLMTTVSERAIQSNETVLPEVVSVTIKVLSGDSNDIIEIVFSEDVTQASATDLANYAISNPMSGNDVDLNLATIVYDPVTFTVKITVVAGDMASLPVGFEQLAINSSYDVAITNILDINGNEIAGSTVVSEIAVTGDKRKASSSRGGCVLSGKGIDASAFILFALVLSLSFVLRKRVKN